MSNTGVPRPDSCFVTIMSRSYNLSRTYNIPLQFSLFEVLDFFLRVGVDVEFECRTVDSLNPYGSLSYRLQEANSAFLLIELSEIM